MILFHYHKFQKRNILLTNYPFECFFGKISSILFIKFFKDEILVVEFPDRSIKGFFLIGYPTFLLLKLRELLDVKGGWN